MRWIGLIGAYLLAAHFLGNIPDIVRAAEPSAAPSQPQLTAEQRQQLEAEAKRLWDGAQQLDMDGKLPEAIRAGKELIAVERQRLGNNDQAIAFLLEWLAARCERLEDFATAKPARQEALDIKIRLVGTDHWRVTDARCAVARVDLMAQLSNEERARLRVALARNGDAMRFYGEGKYSEALRAVTEALEIRKKVLGEIHTDYAQSLNNLAFMYKSVGNYSQAEPLYRQALEIDKKVLGELHPEYSLNLSNLADLYQAMSDYARAEPLYREALEIRKKALGETHSLYAQTLNNLAVLYEEIGDYARAEPLCRQASEIWKKALGTMHPDYATCLNNLARMYESMGDYARAEPLYRQALEIRKKAVGETHPDVATNLSNLAGLYQSMGDYARAEPLYRQTLEIDKKVVGEVHPDYAQSLNNLAVLYLEMGDYARAEPLSRQALEIRKKALGETHAAYATSLNNLAGLYREKGDYAKAEPLSRQALEIRKKALGETHPDYATSLYTLAGLYREMGDYAQAYTLNRDALRITRKNLELAADLQSERQQLAMLGKGRYQLDALVALATAAPQYGSGAFDEALAWKGLVLSRQRAMRAATERPELAPVWDELRTTATKLATLSFATPPPAKAEAWKARIAELSRQKESVEARLSAASKEYRDALQPITAHAVQEALPPNTALVDFLAFWRSQPKPKAQGGGQALERRLAAFVVRREGDVRLVDLGPVPPLGAAIELWRSGAGGTAQSRQAGQTLREKLWLPVEKHLVSVTTVILSPDGELGKLPFAALPGKLPGTFLLEEYLLAIVPSPQAIVGLARQVGPGVAAAPSNTGTAQQMELIGSLLVLGDVNYDSRMGQATEQLKKQFAARAVRNGADKPFVPLAGTRSELATIQKLYRDHFGAKGLTTLESSAASQEALVREASRHRYLHLATHGYFASPQFKSGLDRSTQDDQTRGMELFSNQSLAGYHPGLLSGLALAGANQPTEEDDGILTAEEVGALNLSGADLVVLSACETGLGKTAGSEGLLGLQRAFQSAGARTLVASLWSVSDEATRMLMERFYENLWKRKMGKLESLHEAQLWMLNHAAEQPEIRRALAARGLDVVEADAATPSNRLPPYYWAAFVLSGDWR